MHPFFGVCSGDENVTCVHAHAFQTGISTHKMQISRLVFQVCKSFLPLCYAYEGGKEHIKSSLLTRLSLMSCFLFFRSAAQDPVPGPRPQRGHDVRGRGEGRAGVRGEGGPTHHGHVDEGMATPTHTFLLLRPRPQWRSFSGSCRLSHIWNSPCGRIKRDKNLGRGAKKCWL